MPCTPAWRSAWARGSNAGEWAPSCHRHRSAREWKDINKTALCCYIRQAPELAAKRAVRGVTSTQATLREQTALTVSALQALERLREGNRRFISNGRSSDTFTSEARRREVASGQEPFAIILGCSDSRVPAEIVFDQGLGDLFVIRVAGNIVAPSQVGSVEFAAERFGTRLVVVLGHSNCGAIGATLDELGRPSREQSKNLRSIVDRIRPSVEPLLATPLKDQPEALVREAVRANIRVSAGQLRHGSDVLEQLILNDGLLVVGAEYSLETGVVEFFDGPID